MNYRIAEVEFNGTNLKTLPGGGRIIKVLNDWGHKETPDGTVRILEVLVEQ